MTATIVYLLTAVLLFALALTGLLLTHHLVRKVLALNVMASAVFLLLVVFAFRPGGKPSAQANSPVDVQAAIGEVAVDPVPHAMVLTGIVVSFSASALVVALSRRIHAVTGEARLPEEQERG